MSHNPRLIVPISIDTRSLSPQNQKHIIETYTHDNNGNRASATVHNETITASYALDDSLVVYGDNSYRYDEDGYLNEKIIKEGTSTYRYGTMGELLSVNTPTQTISYKHNANNQRVAKLVDGTITEKYLWASSFGGLANPPYILAVYDKDD
ncbi:MAG: hypothetical protein U9R27_03670, partial [Campylobacterota bacterium]|nr:hypothetical protein [Campylobacterota bacterium]